MRYYLVHGEQRMATVDDPQIPAELADSIQTVLGLYTIKDRPYVRAEHVQVPMWGVESGGPEGYLCNSGGYYIFPADFTTIYDLKSVYGQGISGLGQTIALLERSGVYLPDIQNFATLVQLSLKNPTTIVPPMGNAPPAPAGPGDTVFGEQKEATLDVTRAASIAPGANIDLIASLTTEDGIILPFYVDIKIDAEYVVDTNPQIMSISFGECEQEAGFAGVQFWDTLFSQAAAEGISVFVSSGDSGAAGCDSYNTSPPDDQIENPNYICSSPYITCVCGKEFGD